MMPDRTSRPPQSASASVAQRARAIRIARGLSQLQLAARAGVSLQTVSLAERAGLLTATTAEKLAAVLGVRPEELRQT